MVYACCVNSVKAIGFYRTPVLTTGDETVTKVLLATSEATPFAKTGGLADVCGTLPRELKKLGHEVTLILPGYRNAFAAADLVASKVFPLEIPVGTQIVTGEIRQASLPDSDVTVYFICQDDYYGREGLYGQDGEDYRDNCQRFVFFSRAVLEAIRVLNLDVDVIHCNDWQTGLIPVYLRTEYQGARGYENIATVFTVHNLAYQGRFWHWDMLLTGLDWKYFNWQQLEFFGDLNLMKAGIVFADSITTVSARYAEEIQTPLHGCGLDNVLKHRADCLTGILNGVDYSTWNPGTDEFLPQNYGVDDWAEGKAACKRQLQAELGLDQNGAAPLLGMVSRLAEQKGLELIIETMRTWVERHDAQWVILGTGDRRIEHELQQLSEHYPHRVAVKLEFNESIAHQIEASADLFLMPSRYEPCGLNQLYSLKYGAVPVVHATGGLYDTVVDSTADALSAGTANGFVFTEYDRGAFEAALARACDVYRNQPDQWNQIVSTGMQQDWSWTRSAKHYAELYSQTISRVRQTICA